MGISGAHPPMPPLPQGEEARFGPIQFDDAHVSVFFLFDEVEEETINTFEVEGT